MGTDKRRDWIALFHSFNLIRDDPFHPWLKFFGFSRTEEFFDHGFHGWARIREEIGFRYCIPSTASVMIRSIRG
jgi:hypothetical protein